MAYKKMTIAEVVAQKGYVESLYMAVVIAFRYAHSFLRIISLRARGYRIAWSALILGSNFFQSTYGAIAVGAKSRIGNFTRLDAGYDGTIHIGSRSLIDDHCFITAQSSVRIGNNVLMAAYCFVTDFNHSILRRDMPVHAQGYQRRPVIIEDDVWIGAHCVILLGVHIGKGAVIGAGSVVTHDVEPYTVVAGNPAKHIRTRP